MNISQTPKQNPQKHTNKIKSMHSDDEVEEGLGKGICPNGDGIPSTVWGPPKWLYLGCVARDYPLHPSAKRKKHICRYLSSLRYTLPNRTSRSNLRRYYEMIDWKHRKYEMVENRATLTRFMHALYNDVRKGQEPMTLEKYIATYDCFRARCVNGQETNPCRPEDRAEGEEEDWYGVVHVVKRPTTELNVQKTILTLPGGAEQSPEVQGSVSSYGMRSSVWGPPKWVYLGCVARDYPTHPSVKRKKYMLRYLSSLRYTLPCRICRCNLRRYYRIIDWKHRKHEIVENRASLTRFLHALYNDIRRRKGQDPISLEKYMEPYASFHTEGDPERQQPDEDWCCVVQVVKRPKNDLEKDCKIIHTLQQTDTFF